jgi:dienelactone hydrolase
MLLKRSFFILIQILSSSLALGQDRDVFNVIKNTGPSGPVVTPYLRYQTSQMWRYDDARRKTFDNLSDERSVHALQADIKSKILNMIGGLPQEKTALNAKITGKIQLDGFHIEKVAFESIPGFHVTALVYIPDNNAQTHPAVLVACGHSPTGKIHYQALCQRLVRRGYLVICWDPVGQGERSQFWDEARSQSRYNMVCGEHAVLGNFAYLAGTNLMRWETWDGIRAVDYLFTRTDVDVNRISITGTSGGGTQAAHIGALDERIKVVAPSCYITSLPMRAYNRIFADPDSDPEQDLYGTISSEVDHPGLLLLVYPRPLFIASAVLDFFPIEGARKTFREVAGIYRRFGNGENIGMAEGYHKHQFSPENQEAAMNFMDRFNQLPKTDGLGPVKELSEKELWVTSKGQVTLEFQHETRLMDLVRDYFKDHQSTTNTIGYKAGQLGKMESENKGQFRFEGVTVDRFVIHHSEYLTMPLLYFHGKSQKTVVLLSLNGKASKEEISKRIKNGESVITFDFRGTGEDKMKYLTVSSDELKFDNVDSTAAYVNPLSGVMANYVYNSLLLGRSYFLQMIEDTEIATAFARDHLGVKEISVGGTEDTWLLRQEIVKSIPGIKAENDKNDRQGLSWSQIITEKREQWPIQYLVPGGAYVR